MASKRHIRGYFIILMHLHTIVAPLDIFKDLDGCLLYYAFILEIN